MQKKLVVFYSWGENTKAVAEYIRLKTNADMLELKTKDEYPTDYNACVNKVGRDGKNYEPQLVNSIPDLNEYGPIFVGSPCWWGTIANPLRTFLHQNNVEGKTIAPFMTHGTSGLHIQDIIKLCPDSKIVNGLGIFNKYQVSTMVNSVLNMGNFRIPVDSWLQQIGL